MSIAIALKNIAPDYGYRGSLTAENKEAFDDLVDLGGVKPIWSDVEIELLHIDGLQREETAKTNVQIHLDSTAKTKGFDSILSACSYGGHTNPFQAEGQAFVSWRGLVWEHCYKVLADVEAGTIQEPTIEELIASLPQLNLGV